MQPINFNNKDNNQRLDPTLFKTVEKSDKFTKIGQKSLKQAQPIENWDAKMKQQELGRSHLK